MFVFFIGVVVWAFRPGSRKIHEDTANIPFRYDDKPAGDRE
jgi:cytochrome c oxidase cbb3-type subunit 4